MESKQIKQANGGHQAAHAKAQIWDYVFGFTPMAVVKCAIELQIPDVLESHGGSMTHSELATTVRCSSTILRRIMRYLSHRGFFKQTEIEPSIIQYTQTPLSRLLLKNGSGNTFNLRSFILMESSPVMLAPWHRLSSRALIENGVAPFGAEHGEDVWEYAAENPAHSRLINDAMANHAELEVSAIIDNWPEVFEGIGSVVDVGGGDGTALRSLVKAFPRIRGINLDLPHVASEAPLCEGVENVGGDMFEFVPRADAAFLMWVLHDWSDDECIHILRKCREAISKDKGKVIIVEAVIRERENDKYTDVRLALDMVMLAHTEKGKERSIEEWEYVVSAAGFTKYTVKHIDEAISSIIEAYP